MQRDAGETQLEMDQRLVRDRIARTKRQLREVVQHRAVQRKQRMRVPVPTASIVGYTNAGKSSLLNAMTGSKVLAEDKLFATLDPTSRRLELPSGHELVLTDTVGFIRKLPHRLVDAFKATLEEALIADFLIHVIDLSSPDFAQHRETTLSVLKELGAEEKSVIQVFNKVDLLAQRDPERLQGLRAQYRGECFLSARTGEGMEGLYDRITRQLEGAFIPVELLIPHERYDLVALVHRDGTVRAERAEEEGIILHGSIPPRLAERLAPFTNGRVHAVRSTGNTK